MGPRADGTIPEIEQQMLREMGRWLAVHGEGIYDTHPWRVFGEGPTPVPEGAFTDTARDAFTPADIRFTQKDNTLYAFLLAYPQGQAHIESLGSGEVKVTGARMLGSDAAIEWSQDEGGLSLSAPPQQSEFNVCCYAIELAS